MEVIRVRSPTSYGIADRASNRAGTIQDHTGADGTALTWGCQPHEDLPAQRLAQRVCEDLTRRYQRSGANSGRSRAPHRWPEA
jgi:hypothetical protein